VASGVGEEVATAMSEMAKGVAAMRTAEAMEMARVAVKGGAGLAMGAAGAATVKGAEKVGAVVMVVASTNDSFEPGSVGLEAAETIAQTSVMVAARKAEQ